MLLQNLMAELQHSEAAAGASKDGLWHNVLKSATGKVNNGFRSISCPVCLARVRARAGFRANRPPARHARKALHANRERVATASLGLRAQLGIFRAEGAAAHL